MKIKTKAGDPDVEIGNITGAGNCAGKVGSKGPIHTNVGHLGYQLCVGQVRGSSNRQAALEHVITSALFHSTHQ